MNEALNITLLSLKLNQINFKKLLPTENYSTHLIFDEKFNRLLTTKILENYFNLKVNLMEDRLCPAVPNRLFYLHWLYKILSLNLPNASELVGLDIGIGHTCIYPILGIKLSPRLKFCGTEIDEISYKQSVDTLKVNELEDRIKLKLNSDPSVKIPLNELINGQENGISKIDFTLCNPPFYKNNEEIEALKDNKVKAPNSVCTASNNELITTGGELQFIQDKIKESYALRDNIKLFSTLIGIKSNLIKIKEELETLKANFVTTTLVSGKTSRWFICWSFSQTLLDPAIYYPTFNLTLAKQKTIEDLMEYLKSLQIEVNKINEDDCEGLEGDYYSLKVREFTWTRKFRRERMKRGRDGEIKANNSNINNEEKKEAENNSDNNEKDYSFLILLKTFNHQDINFELIDYNQTASQTIKYLFNNFSSLKQTLINFLNS